MNENLKSKLETLKDTLDGYGAFEELEIVNEIESKLEKVFDLLGDEGITLVTRAGVDENPADKNDTTTDIRLEAVSFTLETLEYEIERIFEREA
jgi:hypothetical protein